MRKISHRHTSLSVGKAAAGGLRGHVEWRSLRIIDGQLIGKRKGVEYSEASANRGLSVAERVPGKADPWLEVFGGRVLRKEGVVERTRGRIGAGRRQVLNQALSLSRNRFEFVTQTQVHGQVRTNFPVVLKIHARDRRQNFVGLYIRRVDGSDHCPGTVLEQ